MDGEDGNLNDRFRANLSRGATAVPMGANHEEMALRYAEDMVLVFEQAANLILTSVANENHQALKRNPHLTAGEILRSDFFITHYARQLERTGLTAEEVASLGKNDFDGETRNLMDRLKS